MKLTPDTWTIPRLGVALAAGGTCLLPWLDPAADNWDRALAVLAGIAGAALLITAFVPPDRWLAGMLDPAALAAFVLAADGTESLLQQRPWPPAIRNALYTYGAALVAIALAAQARRWLAEHQ